MQEDLQAEYGKFIQLNEDSSRKLCAEIIQDLHAPVLQASQDGKYTVPGGYELYMDDMNKVENDYRDSPARGVMRQSVWREFLDEQESRRREVLATDKELNKKAKELAG